MSEKEKINKEALLNKIKNSSVVAPDKIDGVQFEGNGVIGEEEELDLGAAIEFQINDIEKDKERRKEKIKAKVVDNLRKKKEERKTLMIKPGKSSDYNTRSDDYMSEPMRAMHVILNRSETEVYKDGVDPCPRKLMS